jgi:hypothetical protein
MIVAEPLADYGFLTRSRPLTREWAKCLTPNRLGHAGLEVKGREQQHGRRRHGDFPLQLANDGMHLLRIYHKARGQGKDGQLSWSMREIGLYVRSCIGRVAASHDKVIDVAVHGLERAIEVERWCVKERGYMGSHSALARTTWTNEVNH